MGETIQHFKNQLNDYWQETDKAKRKKIITIGIILLLSIIILTFIFTRTRYEVLYSGLSLEDVGETTGLLDELGVKWKTPKDEPTTILVATESKDMAKIELAKEGLPESSYSFSDAFDESSWTMTDYDKKERMKLALQNELASTISLIDGINNATVYINLKDDTGFVLERDQNKSTASVFLESKSNRTLKSESIVAIQNLVASSINMDPDQVQVVDSEGNLLSSSQDEFETLMTDQFLIKGNLENKINSSMTNFLENIFGAGNVDIRSSVIINFDSEKTSSVEFAPPLEDSEEGLIRSSEETEEEAVGGNAQGVPGVEENVPNYAQDNGIQEGYNRSSSVLNYELNQINREIQRAPGQVEDITVAVLVNRIALENGELTQGDIESLVTAATGLNTRQVEVHSGNFFTGGPEMEGIGEGARDLNWPVIIAAIVGVVAIVAFIIYRRRKNNEDEIFQDTIADEQTILSEVEDLKFEPEKSEVKEKVDGFVDENPETVAQLLRTWLNE